MKLRWSLVTQVDAVSEASVLIKDVFDHVSVDIGEAEVAPLESVCEEFVVDAEKVHHRGMKVVHVDSVLAVFMLVWKHGIAVGIYDVVSPLVGLPMYDAGFDTTTCHP